MPAGTLLSNRPLIGTTNIACLLKVLFISSSLLGPFWQAQAQQHTQDMQQASVQIQENTATHGQQLQVTPTRGLRNNKPFEIAILIPLADLSKASTECTSLSLVAMENNGIVVSKPATESTGNGCLFRATLTIDTTASPGQTFLYLRDQKGKLLFSPIQFDVVDAIPGPIPPGLAPQVDVMWTVLPREIVKDVFGGWVWRKYFVIELVVGNNTGYELQLASVGFQLRQPDGTLPRPPADDGEDSSKIPTNDYHIVRGTLEKEQQFGVRATLLNSINAVGLIGSGFIPFFIRTSHRANFAQGVDIVSGPVARAFSLTYPDPTVSQLIHLDNLALRDSSIIPNNTQVRFVGFVSRATLDNYFAQHGKKPEKTSDITTLRPCAGTSKSLGFLALGSTPTQTHCDGNNPLDIRWWLGRLIMIGDRVQYLNRIHIVSAPAEASTTAITLTPDEFDIDKLPATVTLRGPNLDLMLADQKDIGDNLALNLGSAQKGAAERTGSLTIKTGKASADIVEGKQVLQLSVSDKTVPVAVTLWKAVECTPTPPQISLAEAEAGKEVKITDDKNCPASDPNPQVTITKSGFAFTYQRCSDNTNQKCIVIKKATGTPEAGKILLQPLIFATVFHKGTVTLTITSSAPTGDGKNPTAATNNSDGSKNKEKKPPPNTPK